MQYRNTKTGAVIDVNSEIGGDWELIPNSRISVIEEAEPEQNPEQKPEKKTKKTRKK